MIIFSTNPKENARSTPRLLIAKQIKECKECPDMNLFGYFLCLEFEFIFNQRHPLTAHFANKKEEQREVNPNEVHKDFDSSSKVLNNKKTFVKKLKKRDKLEKKEKIKVLKVLSKTVKKDPMERYDFLNPQEKELIIKTRNSLIESLNSKKKPRYPTFIKWYQEGSLEERSKEFIEQWS